MKSGALSMKSNRTQGSKVVVYIFLIVLAIIACLPFYIMIVNASHSSNDIVTKVNLFVGNAVGANYKVMMEQVNIWRGFLNSVIISVSFTALSAYFGALTAFGFAKYKFKYNSILFAIVLASMMIPQQLGIIGFYQLNMKLHLLNSLIPLIVTGIANGSTVFFLKGYIESAIPDSIMESARLEGSNDFGIFNKIVFPCILPGVATMSIFNFVASWNNFLTPLILIFDNKKYPLPVMIAMIKGLYLSNYGAMYLAIAISVVPIIVVFMFCSKYIINGVTLGSEK